MSNCAITGVLFPDAINSHLSTESGWHAVVGYFGANPFSCPVALSPLNSVPKDSTKRCIVIDLSWPAGSSMNNGISSSSYLGEEISLTYLTVDNIASLIWSTGAGCLIYKQTLIRTYRQFPVDPQDYPLLEYCWNHDLYFDAFLTNGFAVGCDGVSMYHYSSLFYLGGRGTPNSQLSWWFYWSHLSGYSLPKIRTLQFSPRVTRFGGVATQSLPSRNECYVFRCTIWYGTNDYLSHSRTFRGNQVFTR